MKDVVLAVHGGSGNPRPGAAGEAGRREALTLTLEEGRSALGEGATALAVVEMAVRRLESHPLFNAGRGSVLNAAGEVEMDASIMDGATGRSGAVCAVRRIAHPISAARLVMEQSEHAFLCAVGAERFALLHGAEPADPSSLVTRERREQLERHQREGGGGLDLDDEEPPASDAKGTVGAVARDSSGHLAAATSTGGLVGKMPGRVGDSPIIGSGTWARDATCAVSLTGEGESILRVCAAHEVDARLRLGGESLDDAGQRAVNLARDLGGRAALIALDPRGRVTARFTTTAMYRGWIAAEGAPVVKIFDDE